MRRILLLTTLLTIVVTAGSASAASLAKKHTQQPTRSASSCAGKLRLPVDLALVTSIGPPGQIRGRQYKGHGYFRLSTNDAVVSMPVAAKLYEGSRYVELGEVQYLLYFRTACGAVVLFDHVLRPSPRVLSAFAGKPKPKRDDSRTYSLPGTAFAAGAKVADAVGFRKLGNASVDFGVYDLTKPNKASKRPGFRGSTSSWRDVNALCWYDMFGSKAAARIRSLVGLGSVEGAKSDVCS